MNAPFKMNPGRGPMQKTGNGIPTALLQSKDKKTEQYEKELQEVRKQDKDGGVLNTLSNIGTGLKHGWNSVGYDSEPIGKPGDLFYSPGGNKNLGKGISTAVSTAYNYATGSIPKKVTEENKPKKVRQATWGY